VIWYKIAQLVPLRSAVFWCALFVIIAAVPTWYVSLGRILEYNFTSRCGVWLCGGCLGAIETFVDGRVLKEGFHDLYYGGASVWEFRWRTSANHRALCVPLWILAAMALVIVGITMLQHRRQLLKRRLTHCAKCDYPILGTRSSCCPECGSSCGWASEARPRRDCDGVFAGKGGAAPHPLDFAHHQTRSGIDAD